MFDSKTEYMFFSCISDKMDHYELMFRKPLICLLFVYTNLKVYHFLIKKCTTPNRLRRYA